MSESPDHRLYRLIEPHRLPDGSISVQYSTPDLTQEGDTTLLPGVTVKFKTSQLAYKALKDDAKPPFTQQMFEEAISEGGSLLVRETPEYSKTDKPFTEANAPQPVYFRMLPEDLGSCIGLSPSEPAKEVPHYPGLYSFRSTHEAVPFLGRLRDVLDDDEITVKLKLELETPTGWNYLCTVVATHDSSRCTAKFVKASQTTNTRTVKKNMWETPVTSANTASVS